MKRIISIIMAVSVFITAFSFCAGGKTSYDGYPIVLVPGYASASLCYDENGETHAAWGWELRDIIPPLLKSTPEMVNGIRTLSATGDNSALIESAGSCLMNILDAMRCNPDGTSVKNVHPVLFSAKETCDSYMNKKYPDGDYRVELDMTKALDALVGAENVFYFNCDFRMSAVDCANDLNRYIDDVKAYTGSDKVNIVAVSHGGLITATYLSLYLEKGDLNNVVMDEPALTGAGIAADILKYDCDFDEETMVRYLEYHSVCETDFNWIVRAHQMGFLDDILEKLIPHIKDGLIYWNSIWDFIAPDDYEELKAKHLDSEKSAGIIEKSDYVHYKVMANYKKIFRDAQASGVRVNIIAGSGNRILSGQNDNSDGIITVKSSTGAHCAPYGKRFSDFYVQTGISSDRAISPSMDIDLTDGYLPDNTWIVNGLFHGMEFWDEYSRSLLFKLLLSEKPVDVHTLAEYPQFKDTTSATSDVYVSFDKSCAGFIGIEDSKLIIKNCSQKRTAYILSVKSQNVKLDFDLEDVYSVSPGESTEIPFSGKLPTGVTFCQVTVNYIMTGTVTPLCRRSQTFTAVNGEGSAEEDGGFADASFPTTIENKKSSIAFYIAEKVGIQELADIIADSDAGRFIKYFIYK